MRPKPREEGMILVNVLLFVAIAAGIVALMIGREDAALQRATMMREAARARAAALGGELSAITALRRDALDGPDSDDAGEPWAKLGERGRAIAGGTFDLAIADAQGRFNVNTLASGDAVATATLDRIAKAVGLPPEAAVRAVELIRLAGPLTDLRPLRLAGLDPAVAARLAGLVTALPYDGKVNLNAASPELLGILIDKPAAVASLVAERQRRGFITRADLAAQDVALPPGTGFTSNLFWVRTRVRIGDTGQQLTTLLARRREPDGRIIVAPIARWTGGSPPEQAPALP